MKYLDEIDVTAPAFGDLFDELPLWSAPFGLMLLDRVPLKSGLTIVDIGAGSGFLSIELAERCGRGTRVIAVDPWTAAMQRLRRKVEQRQLGNVLLLEQDASSIGLPAASVDVIVSNLGINDFEDPAAVLRECARIARPGATALLTTNLVGHMAEFYEAFREVLVETGQGHRQGMLDAHIQHPGTVDSVEGLLRSADFTVLATETESFRIRFADGSALLRHFFIRVGFIQAWKSIPEPHLVHSTFETLEQKLNALAKARGGLALTIPMACIEARR